MRRWLLISILFLMVASGCYDRHDYASDGDYMPIANCSSATLRSLCNDGCYTTTEDAVCVGYVTSSDRESSFYHKLLIEDNTGGIEVLIGTHSTASQYPIGTQIELRLKGLAAMVKNGVVQVGLPPQSFDIAPRPMEAKEVINSHLIRCGRVEDVKPLNYSVGELNISMCGRLITIDNLLHTPLEGYEDESTIVGYHRFVDGDNNLIFTYVSSYADFASLEMPNSELSVTGILYYESVGMEIGSQYVIKPRLKDDITAIATAP